MLLCGSVYCEMNHYFCSQPLSCESCNATITGGILGITHTHVLIHYLCVQATTNKHTIKRLEQVAGNWERPYRCPYLTLHSIPAAVDTLLKNMQIRLKADRVAIKIHFLECCDAYLKNKERISLTGCTRRWPGPGLVRHSSDVQFCSRELFSLANK